MAYLLKRIEDMKEGEDVVAFAAHVVRWKSTAPGHFVLDGEATYAVVPAPALSGTASLPPSVIGHDREQPAPQPNYPSYLDKPAPVTTNRPDGDLNPAYHLDGMEDEPAVLEARRGSETVGASSEARTPQPVHIPCSFCGAIAPQKHAEQCPEERQPRGGGR